MRLAHFDCVSGVSGDMALAALVSAGWPADELRRVPSRLGLEGVTIEVRDVRRGPFAAVQVEVRCGERQPHRHLHHVEAILDRADLPAAVRDRAKAVFQRLAEAEAEVHGTTVQKVHFHEVGAVDAIVDIAGALLGLDALGVTRVSSSALPLGGGFVDSEHGRIPVPAPATALLLRGAPVHGGPVEAELVTPTGAALLATLVGDWGPPPALRLEQVGTGAGAREFPDHPNVLRLLIGTPEPAPAGRQVSVLETAVDDENPQIVAAVAARLLEAGALDAMVVPATMKKGRAGSWLVVVAEPADADRLARLILTETSTLGVRIRTERRIELPRRFAEVETEFGRVQLKIAVLPDGGERATPEHESVRELAERVGRPAREIAESALAAWRLGQAGAAARR